MFTHSVFSSQIIFSSIHSRERFTFTRTVNTDKSKLTLQVYSRSDKFIGSLIGLCVDRALHNVQWTGGDDTFSLSERFLLKDISVKIEHQDLHFGLLLIYLFSMEVKLNNGRFVYISMPIFDALGFYFNYGFYPDPEAVTMILNYSESEFSFQQKIENRYKYPSWRGDVNLVCEKMHTQVLKHWKRDNSWGCVIF